MSVFAAVAIGWIHRRADELLEDGEGAGVLDWLGCLAEVPVQHVEGGAETDADVAPAIARITASDVQLHLQQLANERVVLAELLDRVGDKFDGGALADVERRLLTFPSPAFVRNGPTRSIGRARGRKRERPAYRPCRTVAGLL